MEQIVINDVQIICKVYNGQRVVTLDDMDVVHKRVSGTAKKNFQNNKKYFIENEDYFELTRRELWEKFSPKSEPLKGNPKIKTYLFAESGYLMVAKSFTDELAWEVQRQLVNSYFKLKSYSPTLQNEMKMPPDNLSVMAVQVNKIESMIESQSEILNSVIDNMTISTRQQEKILRAGRSRVNYLLGGAHSVQYMQMGRTYLANLWNNFKKDLHCGSSYKDLNPKDFNRALDYIESWEYRK